MKILIMAGGSGERFWPLSTKERPKQLLPLISEKTMIRETVERLVGYVEFKDIYVATNDLQYSKIIDELPEIPQDNIIIEPSFRDTAAAILYGSTYIAVRNGEDSVITVLASDHLITKKQKFIDSLKLANKLAFNENKIVTLGIKPNYPETGYGYIRVDNSDEGYPNYQVSFIEKPDLDKAKSFLDSGKFLWNSGMFIFKYSTILDNFNRHSKQHLNVLRLIESDISNFTLLELAKKVSETFHLFPRISIDFAIMEKSNNVVCIPVDIGWSDIGTFDSLKASINPNSSESNNIIKGFYDYELICSSNNLLISTDPSTRVYLIDVNDLIVVKSKENLLILKNGSSSKIKDLLKKLNEKYK